MGIHRVLLLMTASILLMPSMSLRAQNITLEGDHFYDEHGQPFFPMVMSYYVDQFYTGTPNSFPADPSPMQILDLGHGRSSLWSFSGQYNYPPAEGAQRLLQDFSELKAQGFNTVRMVSNALKKADEPGFDLRVKHHPTGQHSVMLNMVPPYVADIDVNPVVWFHFNTMLAVCSIANILNMKVVLEPVLGQALIDCMPGDAVNLDHRDFLSAFASFMHGHEVRNLLAYEFFGEPTPADRDPNGTWHWKHEICELARTWNTAVKSADPDHLTTIGGFYHDDLMPQGWDPMLLEVDFASMHFYPLPDIYEWQQNPATYLEHTTERFLNMVRHYDRYLKKPYIIMETGFSGEDPFSPGGAPNPLIGYPLTCYGNELDQDDFLRATFPAIRDSRCAGWGWWIFMNMHWLPDPNADNVQAIGFASFKERYFGILRFGDPESAPAPGTTGWESHRKLAAQTLADWVAQPPPHAPLPPVPPAVDMNDRYYNPFMHPPNSTLYPNAQAPTQYGTLTGQVVDQDGAPVPGAVIRGHSYSHATVNEDGQLVREMYAYYTYTDGNGWFEMRAYDPEPGLSSDPDDEMGIIDRTVEDMKIGAHAGQWLHVQPPFQQHATYELRSMQDQVDRLLDGITVPAAASEYFGAYATLTAHNVLVEGQAELVARYEVNLLPGFHAKVGSNMHAYTAPVFVECDDIASVDLRSLTASVPVPNSPPAAKQPPERELEIAFHTPSPHWDVELFPNPTMGMVHGRITGYPGTGGIRLELRDAGGSRILQRPVPGARFDLDLSSLAPGAYALTLLAGDRLLVRHIIRH